MSEDWIGVVVSGAQLNGVHMQFDKDSAIVNNQFTWKLQSGNDVLAYAAIHDRFRDYVRNNAVNHVVVKGSSVGQNRPTLAHLKSAELRGVICVASVIGGASTKLVQKGTVSRTYGDRKVDEYIKDDSFWDSQVVGELTKGRREAALLVLSQRD